LLAEQGAFNSEFIINLKDMYIFRNRLVHIYWEVDCEQVYEILQKRSTDFKTFLDKIACFIELENSNVYGYPYLVIATYR